MELWELTRGRPLQNIDEINEGISKQMERCTLLMD